MHDVIRAALAATDARLAGAVRDGATYRFGDRDIAIRIERGRKTLEFLASIDHRRVASAAGGAILDVVDGDRPELARLLLPPPGKRRERFVFSSDDAYYFWAPDGAGIATAVDRVARRGLVWYLSADYVPSWEAGQPFLYALKGFLDGSDYHLVHSAAVTHNGRAVLITGRGNAGKSTMALTCAAAGWPYVGDDFVMIGGSPARVASVFMSARLREDMFARMPEAMAGCLSVSTDSGETRAEIDVGRIMRMAPGDTPIAAIVVPRRNGAAQATATPMRRSEVIHALVPPTVNRLAGDAAATYQKLTAIVGSLPCYAVDPGPDLARVPDAIAALVDGS